MLFDLTCSSFKDSRNFECGSCIIVQFGIKFVFWQFVLVVEEVDGGVLFRSDTPDILSREGTMFKFRFNALLFLLH
jgi:hypothetical protein